MSNDSTPPRRLSQIFDSLTSLSERQQYGSYSPTPPTTVSSSSSSSTKTGPAPPLPLHQTTNAGLPLQGYNYNTTSSTSTSISSTSNQSGKISSSSSAGGIVSTPTTRIIMGSRSTPNSPRLMSRRIRATPPAIPQKSPNAACIANPSLVALDSDAPWPHFSSLTDHLDVHQVNNYQQSLPEVIYAKKLFYLILHVFMSTTNISFQINWQERCLELQLELHRSRNQAGRVRDMLREKVSVVLFSIDYLQSFLFRFSLINE